RGHRPRRRVPARAPRGARQLAARASHRRVLQHRRARLSALSTGVPRLGARALARDRRRGARRSLNGALAVLGHGRRLAREAGALRSGAPQGARRCQPRPFGLPRGSPKVPTATLRPTPGFTEGANRDPSAYPGAPERANRDPSAYPGAPEGANRDPSAYPGAPERANRDPSAYPGAPAGANRDPSAYPGAPEGANRDPSAYPGAPEGANRDPSAYPGAPEGANRDPSAYPGAP